MEIRLYSRRSLFITYMYIFPEIIMQVLFAELLLRLFWLLFLQPCNVPTINKIYTIFTHENSCYFYCCTYTDTYHFHCWEDVVSLKKHSQVWLLAAIFQKLTFTIWLLKLQRALCLRLIRFCGAKSNQYKREQRAKRSLNKRVSVVFVVWLLSQWDSAWRITHHSQSRSPSVF